MIELTSLERNKAALAQGLKQCVFYGEQFTSPINKTLEAVFALPDAELEELFTSLGESAVDELLGQLSYVGTTLNDLLEAQGSAARVLTSLPRGWNWVDGACVLEPVAEGGND